MTVQTRAGGCGAGVKPAAQPILNQRSNDIQPLGTLVKVPLALTDGAKKAVTEALNQILADSIYLREMYRKSEWQTRGATFRQMNHLFHSHGKKQNKIVQRLGNRVETLGGVTVVVPNDIVRMTRIEVPPSDREELPVQISRLLEAHEVILEECHAAVKLAEQNGDDGTEELLQDDVILPGEKQVWRLSAHLTDTPLVCAST